MKTIIENVIKRGGYSLPLILEKIDTLWVGNKLSDADREELIDLAREKANVTDSIDFEKMLLEHDKLINQLWEAVFVSSSEQQDTDESETAPDFVVGKTYYSGDQITFKGLTYICTAPEGAVCVWSPEDYPVYWEEIIK